MIRILLAEDMHMVRGALVALLSLEADLEVVAEVAEGTAILPNALAHRPDVAVLDIGLPGIDGLAAASVLSQQLPACRAIILTSHADSANIARAMLAGVSGFLPKDAPPARLADAIRRVHRGERVIDSEIVVAAFHHGPNPLTERERDVLSHVAKGSDVSDVAAKLYLAPGTVRNYLSAIMSKIGARNRVDAIRIARDRGWISA
ncbi:response regulator transcription factor [Micromonospora sp. NPDC051196]|uniref:response regulator transcription factor n=1 Tax=Micromonospora sp. NPDC051196 TaxID=3155281 RepID=UPI003422079A